MLNPGTYVPGFFISSQRPLAIMCHMGDNSTKPMKSLLICLASLTLLTSIGCASKGSPTTV